MENKEKPLTKKEFTKILNFYTDMYNFHMVFAEEYAENIHKLRIRYSDCLLKSGKIDEVLKEKGITKINVGDCKL